MRGACQHSRHKILRVPTRYYLLRRLFTSIFICYFSILLGGKRDEHLILPLNDSVSLTLDYDQGSFH